MSKRRTRKEKEKAKHPFTYNWENTPEKAFSEPRVKRQIKNQVQPNSNKMSHSENAMLSAKDASLASIKRNIRKSIIIASLILIVELVIYLAWL
jgi:HEAT repeat protein